MRILFLSKTNSPSFQFYSESLLSINLVSGFEITCSSGVKDWNYELYDIVLFMWGSNDSIKAKRNNNKIFCGIVDPRGLSNDQFISSDFIIVNGVESQIFFSEYGLPTFIYPVYPKMTSNIQSKTYNELLLGYHGNKIHLEDMMPRITKALQELHEHTPIIFHAMYNIKDLGRSDKISSSNLGFKVKHIQYSVDNYEKYISCCDIGIVPQLIKHNKIPFFEKNKVNYNMKFKSTTNLGRHFVFCQYKIPIVTDLTPSSSEFFQHGVNGLMAYSTKSWKESLLRLNDSNFRKLVGMNGFKSWSLNYSHETLNKKLLGSFLELKR
jgi:hypothetical protein